MRNPLQYECSYEYEWSLRVQYEYSYSSDYIYNTFHLPSHLLRLMRCLCPMWNCDGPSSPIVPLIFFSSVGLRAEIRGCTSRRDVMCLVTAKLFHLVSFLVYTTRVYAC